MLAKGRAYEEDEEYNRLPVPVPVLVEALEEEEPSRDQAIGGTEATVVLEYMDSEEEGIPVQKKHILSQKLARNRVAQSC